MNFYEENYKKLCNYALILGDFARNEKREKRKNHLLAREAEKWARAEEWLEIWQEFKK